MGWELIQMENTSGLELVLMGITLNGNLLGGLSRIGIDTDCELKMNASCSNYILL